MVVVRCVRHPAGRPGGVGDGGGAFTQHGKARGGRGARWFTAALPWPRRPSRERARERRGWTRERGRGPGGSAWHRAEASGRAGREEVEASGAQASTRLCLLAEVEDNRSSQWAGPSSWLHQVSGPGGLLLYFNFCSVFLYLIFLTLFFKLQQM